MRKASAAKEAKGDKKADKKGDKADASKGKEAAPEDPHLCMRGEND